MFIQSLAWTITPVKTPVTEIGNGKSACARGIVAHGRISDHACETPLTELIASLALADFWPEAPGAPPEFER